MLVLVMTRAQPWPRAIRHRDGAPRDEVTPRRERTGNKRRSDASEEIGLQTSWAQTRRDRTTRDAG